MFHYATDIVYIRYPILGLSKRLIAATKIFIYYVAVTDNQSLSSKGSAFIRFYSVPGAKCAVIG